MVPKSRRRFFKGRRWAKPRIRFNPMVARNPGFFGQIKEVFTLDTLKVVGGGLVGFGLSAAIGDALAKVAVNPTTSPTAYVLVGLGGGVVVAAGGGALLGRWSPNVGRAFFWGGLLGTAIRGITAAMPNQAYLNIPTTSAEANALAVVLAAQETGASSAAAALGGSATTNSAGQAFYNQQLASGMPAPAALALTQTTYPGFAPGVTDWLPGRGAQDYLMQANRGTQDYLAFGAHGSQNHPAGNSRQTHPSNAAHVGPQSSKSDPEHQYAHPLVGGGQTW
jgi:hypothetical protein